MGNLRTNMFVVFTLLTLGATCPNGETADEVANRYSYVRITLGNTIPQPVETWGNYKQVWVCPGDEVTLWWNAKNAQNAFIVPTPLTKTLPLQPNDQATFNAPNMPGDTIYKLDARDVLLDYGQATMSVVGPTGGAVASVSAGPGSVDSTTGQVAYVVTTNSALFSPALHVKSIKILEAPGVLGKWMGVSSKEEASQMVFQLVNSDRPLNTGETRILDPGNRPTLRGYWYFAPDSQINPPMGSIVVHFEVFCMP